MIVIQAGIYITMQCHKVRCYTNNINYNLSSPSLTKSQLSLRTVPIQAIPTLSFPALSLAMQGTASSAIHSCLSPFHLCLFVKLDKGSMWPWEGGLLAAALQSARLNVPHQLRRKKMIAGDGRDCRSG